MLEEKLAKVHLSTVRPSTEALSAKQTNGQGTGNAGQSKADDSGAGKYCLLAPLAKPWLLTHHANIGLLFTFLDYRGINVVNTDFNHQEAQKAFLRHGRALARSIHLANGYGKN